MAVKAKATVTLVRVNDGATGPAGPKGATGATGPAGKGIKSTAITYQAGTSGTTAPTGTWSTGIPSVSQGQYLWSRTITTYTDNTTSTAYSVAYIPKNGATGATGAQGFGIVASVERNAFTEANWTTYGTVGHVENWSNTSSIRNGCRIGDLFIIVGTSTDGGKAHTLTYRSTTSSGDLKGECIGHVVSYKGATGATGPKGDTGATGTGVGSITQQYYLSTSKTAQSGGSWVSSMPTWSSGKYLWTRFQIVYTNPANTVYTKPVCDSSWEAVNEIQVGGRNLLLKTNVLYTRAHSAASVQQISFYGALKDESLLKTLIGKEVTLSFHLHSPGERDTSLSTNSSMNNRFGCHLGVTWRNSSDPNGTSKTTYPFGGATTLQATIDRQRIKATERINPPAGYDTITLLWLSLQLYAKPVDENIVWEIGYPQLELGNRATDWTPAPEDVEEDYNEKITVVKQNLVDVQKTADSLSTSVSDLKTATTTLGDDLKVIREEQTELSSRVTQNATSIHGEVSRIDKILDEVQEITNKVSTYFDFDENGFIIGKTDSPYKTQQAPDAFNILYQDNVVGSFSAAGLKTKAMTLEEDGALTLPPLKLSAYANGWIITNA